ncbi:MAG: hypothetical protein ACXW2Q_06920, partial [Thermoanaerobaculia bacterium]
MQSEDRDLLIAWSLLPFLSPARTRLLLESFDPVSSACTASSTLLQGLLSVTPEQAGVVKNPLKNEDARRLLSTVRQNVVALCDSGYPPLLREI